MARSRGFEPLTAWFVARYSIQLSYERAIFDTKQAVWHQGVTLIHNILSEERMARPRGFEPLTAWFVARYSIQLSYGRAGLIVFTIDS